MLWHTRVAIWLIGMISGMALMLTGATLNFWLAKEGLSKAEIGMFSLVAIPYSINFIWTPILDKYRAPLFEKKLGHRMAWVVLVQILLAITVIILGFIPLRHNLVLFAFFALLAAFFSSTNDSLMGAMRSELFSAAEQGNVSGIYVLGYRIGMMICGSGLIYLSLFFSWGQIYQMVGVGFMVLPLILTFLFKYIDRQSLSPDSKSIVQFNSKNIISQIKEIYKPFGSYKFVLHILLLLILYRLADNFINTMINPFLLDLQFQDFDIATVGKLCGSIGAMLGAIIGGRIMQSMNVVYRLLFFGLVHSSVHLLLAAQALIGNNLAFYFITSISESVTGGMAMTAYIAFIASICKGRYLATQQALFTSMMGVSRSILPSVSGVLVSYFGWFNFFIFAFLLSIPALILIYFMRTRLINYIYTSARLD